MQLLLRDPGYTDRLAEFLMSVGQPAVVSGPDRVEVDGDDARVELEIYLRVWRVLHPEADVELPPERLSS
jgi:hypothetical protein